GRDRIAAAEAEARQQRENKEVEGGGGKSGIILRLYPPAFLARCPEIPDATLAMVVIEDTDSFPQHQSGCVATIGKFDGVHIGHQLILQQVRAKAAEYAVPSMVILIEPHPEEFFAESPRACPARLSELEEKLQLLEEQGIDYVYKLRFDAELASLSAEDYIQSILVDGLGLRCLVIGSDFR